MRDCGFRSWSVAVFINVVVGTSPLSPCSFFPRDLPDVYLRSFVPPCSGALRRYAFSLRPMLPPIPDSNSLLLRLPNVGCSGLEATPNVLNDENELDVGGGEDMSGLLPGCKGDD